LDSGGVEVSTEKKRAKASNMVLLSIFVDVEGALLELYVRYKKYPHKNNARFHIKGFQSLWCWW
jgi:hypothetical protein